MTRNLHRISSFALSALLLGTLAAPMASADPAAASAAKSEKQGQGMHHGGKHKGEFMKELNLTEQQKKQFKAAHEKFKQENAGALQAMKAKREALKQLGDDPANEAKRKQLKAELRQEHEALGAKRKASMQGILTPEQQSKWDAKKAERKAQWAERRKHNPNPHPDAQ